MSATINNNGASTPRMSLEDTFHAILDANQAIVELLEAMRDTAAAISNTTGALGNASVEVEDLAKGVKITTKGYVGIPLSREFIEQRIEEHRYAHTLAQEAYDRQWRADLQASTVRDLGRGLDVEPLPDFESSAPR